LRKSIQNLSGNFEWTVIYTNSQGILGFLRLIDVN
jgi:hypothetical protein